MAWNSLLYSPTKLIWTGVRDDNRGVVFIHFLLTTRQTCGGLAGKREVNRDPAYHAAWECTRGDRMQDRMVLVESLPVTCSCIEQYACIKKQYR